MRGNAPGVETGISLLKNSPLGEMKDEVENGVNTVLIAF